MNPMTDETLTAAELAAIKAREKAATPGPWNTERKNDWTAKIMVGTVDEDIADFDQGTGEAEANAAFTAHARTDLPCAIATIRALAEAIGAIEAGAWASVTRGSDFCVLCGGRRPQHEEQCALGRAVALTRRVLGEGR